MLLSEMLRRSVRLRKEYLYKKALEEKENIIRERKERVKNAVANGQPIAPEDRDFEAEYRRKMDLDDARSLAPTSVVDNEYAYAGVKDPKILLTTSRDPSTRLQQFVKELNLVFPNAHRLNRGGYVVKDLVRLCQTNDITDMIVVHEHRGIPDGLVVTHMPLGPTVYFGLQDVVLRHDLPNKPPPMSTVAPHLIFDNFSSRLGDRVMTVLKHLFPPAAPLGKRVLSFVNRNDIIHFRHMTWTDERSPVAKEEAYKDLPADANVDQALSTSTNPLKTDTTQLEDSNSKAEGRAAYLKKKQERSVDGIKLSEVGPRFGLKV